MWIAAEKIIANTGSHPAPVNPHQAAVSRDAADRCPSMAAVTPLQPPSCSMPSRPTAPSPTSTTTQWIRLVIAVPHSPPSET